MQQGERGGAHQVRGPTVWQGCAYPAGHLCAGESGSDAMKKWGKGGPVCISEWEGGLRARLGGGQQATLAPGWCLSLVASFCLPCGRLRWARQALHPPGQIRPFPLTVV